MGTERQKDHIEQRPIVYWAATIGALVGGCLIISDAFYLRAQLKREQNTNRNKQGSIAELLNLTIIM